MAQKPDQPDKVVEIIADGLDGPTIFFMDGTSEHIPVDSDRPPALVHDITFEDRPGGFEVWFSERIAYELEDEVDAFVGWLGAQPGVESLLFEDPVVVMADGRWDDDLRSEIGAWWNEHFDGIDIA